jgi:enoyl-CoA hydratase
MAREANGGTSMGETPAVRIERSGPVTTVILHRPERRNAVDRATAKILAQAFEDFERDDDAKVAVLFGDGGTFCAGADLKSVGTDAGNRVVRPEAGVDWNPLSVDGPMGPSRMQLSKPVIAAICGYAVAGGLELALWCDMRVVEQDASFGVFCRRWGVPLVDGGTLRLPRIIGHGRAMDLILTGREVSADEALSMGLANRVVAVGTAREAAEQLAHEIARFPQICMRADRRSAYDQWSLPYDEALAREYELGMKAIESGETAEGAQRFADGHGRGGRFDDI